MRPIELPDLEPGATTGQLFRRTVAKSVAQLLRHDPGARHGDVEDVHKLRVATRRLRSDMGTFRVMLDDDWVAGLRSELAWLAGQAGAVRDKDVLLDRLAAGIATLSDADAEPGAETDAAGTVGTTASDGDPPEASWPAAADELVDHLRRQRAEAHAQLQRTLLGPRYTELLHALVAAAESPAFSPTPPGDGTGSPSTSEGEGPSAPPAGTPEVTGATVADRAAVEVAPGLARKPWRKLHKAVMALPDDAPDEALHRVRILAKRTRYAAEAVAPVMGADAERFAEAVADLQTVLGDHQDTVVTEAALHDATAALPHLAPAAHRLVARERRERSRLRAGWPEVWRAASTTQTRSWMSPSSSR